MATSLLLLLAYVGFYARYTYWSGDFAWGGYVSTAVERYSLVRCSCAIESVWAERSGARMCADRSQPGIQLASLAFGCRWKFTRWSARTSNVCYCSGSRTFAFFGQDGCRGLNNEAMTQDPWDCSHHDVEFSAVSASPRQGSAGLGVNSAL